MILPAPSMQIDDRELSFVRGLERLYTAFDSEAMIRCVEACLDEATNHMIERARPSPRYDA